MISTMTMSPSAPGANPRSSLRAAAPDSMPAEERRAAHAIASDHPPLIHFPVAPPPPCADSRIPDRTPGSQPRRAAIRHGPDFYSQESWHGPAPMGAHHGRAGASAGAMGEPGARARERETAPADCITVR
jgi:hypothetical protein